jgi:hypothetical protein
VQALLAAFSNLSTCACAQETTRAAIALTMVLYEKKYHRLKAVRRFLKTGASAVYIAPPVLQACEPPHPHHPLALGFVWQPCRRASECAGSRRPAGGKAGTPPPAAPLTQILRSRNDEPPFHFTSLRTF